MNMLPPEPKKLATTHSCFDGENDKLLQQWRSFPVARCEEALFFPIFKPPLAPLWHARASNHLHGIAR
jgi:hypothetical protein